MTTKSLGRVVAIIAILLGVFLGGCAEKSDDDSVTNNYPGGGGGNPPVNHAPVFTPVANITVLPGQAVTFHVTATDQDADVVNLTYTVPTGATFTNIINNQVSVSGDFTWTPTVVGTYSATFTATDEHGLFSTMAVTITVTLTPPVNNPPVFDPINTVYVQTNTTTTFEVRAVDPDTDAVVLTWILPTGATFANVVNNAVTVSGDFSWTPTIEGTFAASFTGTDEHGLAATVTVNIIVTDAPPTNNSYIGIDWAYFEGTHEASIHWDCGYPPDPTEPWHIAATVVGHDAATGNRVREFPNPAAMLNDHCWANIHVIDEALNVCTPSGATDPLTDHWFPTGNTAAGICYALPTGSPHFYYFDGTTQYDLNFTLVDNGVGGSVFEIDTSQGTPPGGDVPIDLVLQPDADGDRVPNSTDNCQIIINPDQLDANSNGIGDVCEGIDSDNDGIYDWDE